MSEQKEGTVGAQAVLKKVRRGVSNETQAVTLLRFHEKDASKNGLFVGHLHEVTVDWSTNENVFNGISVPRLTFHFASNHANANEMRHVWQTLFPVPSNVDTIPGGKDEWRVNNIFAWIKHVLDVYYLKGRNLTEEEENALTLPFVDFDEKGEYVSVEPEEVISGYRALFENAAAMLNGTFKLTDGESPKPVYKTADGKFKPTWMKLLRHKKRKNNWIDVGQNGELAFDGFIGNGVLELVNGNNPPAILRIDMSRESITPKETKKEGNSMMDAINGMGGVSAQAGIAAMNSYAEAVGGGDGDMPF